MSEYIKSTFAKMPRIVHALQSLSSYRPDLPKLQFPTSNLHARDSPPTRYPRVYITFAILLFLLFWKDIIRDVCLHAASRRLPASVAEVSSIRNNTLGVSLLEIVLLRSFANCKGSSKIYSCFPYPNEAIEEHPSSLLQMRQTSHSPCLMP